MLTQRSQELREDMLLKLLLSASKQTMIAPIHRL